MKDYSYGTYYNYDKKSHFFRDCPNRENQKDKSTQRRSRRHLRVMMLNSSHSGDFINQNVLDSGATKYTNNCRDVFTNFQSIKKTAYTATREAIMSYGQVEVVKMMTYGEVTFQNVLYISTFFNNVYSSEVYDLFQHLPLLEYALSRIRKSTALKTAAFSSMHQLHRQSYKTSLCFPICYNKSKQCQ